MYRQGYVVLHRWKNPRCNRRNPYYVTPMGWAYDPEALSPDQMRWGGYREPTALELREIKKRDAELQSRLRSSRRGKKRRHSRRNRSRVQKQARHYKLAQRRGRLGFLRRLKGRANARGRNPYYRTADGVAYRREPVSRLTQRMLGWRRMPKKELQRYIQKWEAGVPMSPFYRPPSMRRHYGSWR